MMNFLKSLFSGTQSEESSQAEEASPRVAFAALLVEAARADEEYTSDEIELIDAVLSRHFDLSTEDATSLRQEGEKAQAESNGLYRFSSQVKEGFSHEEKIGLIEAMWEIILSDEARDPHEEMIVRRLIGLIYISDQESNTARKRVEEKISS